MFNHSDEKVGTWTEQKIYDFFPTWQLLAAAYFGWIEQLLRGFLITKLPMITWCYICTSVISMYVHGLSDAADKSWDKTNALFIRSINSVCAPIGPINMISQQSKTKGVWQHTWWNQQGYPVVIIEIQVFKFVITSVHPVQSIGVFIKC